MVRRILLATDGSVLSRKAARHAIELAARCHAELVILHAVPRYPVAYFEGGVARSTDDVARVERQWNDQGQLLVDRVCAKAASRGVASSAVLAHADVASDAIIKAATRHKCDLIVMASHGRKGIKRLLLGSETQQVLTHSKLPVLVLR